MNHCIFEGYLTRKPELRTAPGPDGKDVSVITFSIGVNNRRGRTSFPNLEAWAQGADTIYKWFDKGDLIRVYCEHITDTWTDKETGKPRYKDKFRVNNFEFPPTNKGRDRNAEPSPGESSESTETPETTPQPQPETETTPPQATPARKPRTQRVTAPPTEKSDDDEIPF